MELEVHFLVKLEGFVLVRRDVLHTALNIMRPLSGGAHHWFDVGIQCRDYVAIRWVEEVLGILLATA